MSTPTVRLSFVTQVCTDMDKLATFYSDLFGLEHVTELEGEHFRALQVGSTILGFNPPIAYELLNLPPSDLTASPATFWTFETENEEQVGQLTEVALSAGATLLKGPFRTYYGAWQSVLLDPEANVFRINRSAVG